MLNAWNEIAEKYKGNMIDIDVRNLEMPQPMHKILESLEELPEGKALFVRHKKFRFFCYRNWQTGSLTTALTRKTKVMLK